MFAGNLFGIVQRATSFDDFHDGINVFQATLTDRFADQFSLFFAAFTHGMNQWQGRFTFG